jgi:DNA primase
MRISEEIIEQVRSSNDIIDVISSYVRLKKRGKNYIGLCPFHQEKTPSFTVSADKQMYHCFGCHKGGNVFTFVMEHDKVAFAEAVRMLAARVGIVIPEGPVTEAQTEQEHFYNACRFAGQMFLENLMKTDEGRGALEYFHNRGFSDETIRLFGLGYSLQSWDGLLVRANKEGITTEHLQKAGLIRLREDGSPYDYFRGRAMFPIVSTAGRVIGFGARKIREDDAVAGKYINSPETSIYNKSRVLFGLFHSKEAIRGEETALMVEGYADLISLFQSGIQNVVASSGTALTEEQLQLLGRYSKTLVLVYDADSAGSDATLRGVDLALEQDFDVRIVRLPEGEDPDTFVRKFGAKEFRKSVSESISFIEFKAQRFYQQGAFSSPERKAEAVRSIVQSIAKMKDELKRNFYVKEVAGKYDIYESVIYRELDKWIVRERKSEVRGRILEKQSPSSVTTIDSTPVAERKSIPIEELTLLKQILEADNNVLEFIASNIDLTDLTDAGVREIVDIVLRERVEGRYSGAQDLVHLIDDAELREIITDVSVSKYGLNKEWQKEFTEGDPWQLANDSIRMIKQHAIKKEMEENKKRLKEAIETSGDTMAIKFRQRELSQQLSELDAATTRKP